MGRPSALVVRSRRPGDEFRPLGGPGAKSVRRFLIDIKVPRAARPRVPVVEAASGATPGELIVWVAPYRLDERARVGDATRTVLALSLRPAPAGAGSRDA
jgi:tRNA(Ile)-lysidine synthase